jgi:hypothetical protein
MALHRTASRVLRSSLIPPRHAGLLSPTAVAENANTPLSKTDAGYLVILGGQYKDFILKPLHSHNIFETGNVFLVLVAVE